MLQDIANRGRRSVVPIVGILVLTYFVYHSIEGDRGLRAWYKLDREIEMAEARVSQSRDVHAGWQRKVNTMRPDSINSDMLEEQARRLLNLVDPNAIILVDDVARGRTQSN